MEQKLIYDVGMHLGEDTDFYLKKGFKVIGIEANPDLVAKCRIKFKDYIAKNELIIIDKAISDKNGNIEFYIDAKDDWGSLYKDWNKTMSTNKTKINVKTVKFEEILQQ